MRPLIALLTDFGTRDPYVAQVKGVIASRCDGEIADLTHEIAPYDVAEGAFFLRDVAGSLRGGRQVIVVAVVDPGVGSARRLLAATDGAITFLGPDNGLLSLALGPEAAVREITNRALFLHAVSSTFHGRDRFAPAAAALARGVAIEELGPPVDRGSIVALDYAPPSYDEHVAIGTVTAIDRFGNVATDLDPARVGGIDGLTLEVRGMKVSRSGETYAAMAGTLDPFLIVGSRGTIEVSVSGGSAATLLRAKLLDRVRVAGERR
ncbi:MAG: SAM-dependent chlorinase/fluorinase [Thermoanaerobaculia bacterium]|nr:SAM-dependent chlorinase/fluorinase [Thermoanaerobaculia bacterium]